jgi:hypothetical protein
MSRNKGMVQVFGTTYRIVARADLHQVIRIVDDRLVGTFRHRPTLQVLTGELDPAVLLRIAGEARKEARLAWSSKRPDAATKWSAWLRTARADWLCLLDTLFWLLVRWPGAIARPILLASAGSASFRRSQSTVR